MDGEEKKALDILLRSWYIKWIGTTKADDSQHELTAKLSMYFTLMGGGADGDRLYTEILLLIYGVLERRSPVTLCICDFDSYGLQTEPYRDKQLYSLALSNLRWFVAKASIFFQNHGTSKRYILVPMVKFSSPIIYIIKIDKTSKMTIMSFTKGETYD